MLFNSVEFLVFFPVVTIIYFLLPYRFRWLFLLAASAYFYMSWEPEYIFLLIFTTLIGYFIALGIARTSTEPGRKMVLAAGVISSLSVLFFFKYFNFFSTSLEWLLKSMNLNFNAPEMQVLLPVGISFYTFHTLNYIIDVYRGRQAPERHLGKLGLFVAFYPLLVAGPIERSTRLLPQFNRENKVDYVRITNGLKLMAWGFFKKLVIADRLAIIVNNVYNQPTEFTGIPLIIATYFFAFQIYCDFSGYSDIAIGAAKVMGYDLMENFRQPYFAKSISDFWRRWHISLSTWFRDYLYIPLGGNRVVKWRWYFNLMVVFVVSGLWHGANWTFVIWGALHGLYLVLSIVIAPMKNRLTSRFNIPGNYRLLSLLNIFVIFHMVVFAWIFFRANTFGDALYIVTHLFTGITLQGGYGLDIGGAYEIMLIGIALLTLFFVEFYSELGFSFEYLAKKPVYVRWLIYYALIFSILIFGKLGTTEFIYFQF